TRPVSPDPSTTTRLSISPSTPTKNCSRPRSIPISAPRWRRRSRHSRDGSFDPQKNPKGKRAKEVTSAAVERSDERSHEHGAFLEDFVQFRARLNVEILN